MSGVQKLMVPEDEAGARLDRWVRRRAPGVTQGRLEKLLRKGEIRVDGKRATAAQRLEAGQEVRLPPLPNADEPGERPAQAPARSLSAEDAAFAQSLVIHRDDAVIALNKPPGLAVQGGSGQTRHVDGLLDALRFGRPDKPRLVHRLDRDTSGALLLGRTPAATAALARAFQSRATRKVYWAALVKPPSPPEGTLKSGLMKVGGAGAEKVAPIDWEDVPRIEGAKRAVTDYAVIESLSNRAAWVALRPVTGRTHQLRAHMAMLRCPIVGDGKYRGDVESVSLGGAFSNKLHLHARSIRIPHPAGGVLALEAELPEHMTRTWVALGWDAAAAPEEPFAALDAELGR